MSSPDNFVHPSGSILAKERIYCMSGGMAVCVCVRLHAACVRQTALFEVAGTGALTACRVPAGYWPTDGAEGGVCWGDRHDCRVEGWELEEKGGALPGVATGTRT